MRNILFILFFVCIVCNNLVFASDTRIPDCSGPDRWAARIVGVHLKNLNLSKKAAGYDKVEVELLATEPLFKGQDRAIFRQVHKVTIYDHGNTFMAITVNDASFEECSESGVDVHFISVQCGADSNCQSYALP